MNLAPEPDGFAFKDGRDLVSKGVEQLSGCTEPVLHAQRLGSEQSFSMIAICHCPFPGLMLLNFS